MCSATALIVSLSNLGYFEEIKFTNSLRMKELSMSATSYVFRLGNWFIVIDIYENGSGALTVTYVGNEALKINNALLPLTAGLNVILICDNGTTTARKVGTYYPNATIVPGTGDTMKFAVSNIKVIEVEGAILGKIPLKMRIPLETRFPTISTPVTAPAIVTITKTGGVGETHTTTQLKCSFVLEEEYREPSVCPIRMEIMNNASVTTDCVAEVYIPSITTTAGGGPGVIIEVRNVGEVPIYVCTSYIEVEIVNGSIDGVNYIPIHKKVTYVVPGTTIPPQVLGCNPPEGSFIIPEASILRKGEHVKIPLTWVMPKEVLEKYKYIYINVKIKYAPIRAIYGVTGELPKYIKNYKAVLLYQWRTIEAEGRVRSQ